jgi:GDP-mannose pyrophosphatase NudK
MAEKKNKKYNILTTKVLHKGWSALSSFEMEYYFADGTKTIVHREIYDSGDGAAVLMHNPSEKKVLLVKQFRLAAVLNGHPDGFILESCAGMLDINHPEKAIIKEIEEETGFCIKKVIKTGEVFATPGAHMEKIHLYTAEYSAGMKIHDGGGNREENEEIEVLEYSFDEIKSMVEKGEIRDAKTLILLQQGILKGLIF